ncbi:MAG: DNA polymerase III subunit delta' [Planctomycetota bacterium]|nr:MAG: DNA polymerase III subunit delta' [Planctomycetota bacterium]
MSIFEVEHQERAHRIIQRALASKRMPHAYLFAGPDGVGKEMLATRLAKTLLCQSPIRRDLPATIADTNEDSKGLDACEKCQDCALVDADTHPDLFLIYRQLNKQHPDSVIRKQKALFLGVEIIRHFLVDRAGTRPNRGKAKVFILREAERMNEAAQNCLLKTLEEPPGATFLIVLTNAADRMLPTTRSRCQQVIFRSLPTEFIKEQLTTLRPDADQVVIDYVAKHAAGSLGAALQQIDDDLFSIKQNWGQQLTKLVASKTAPAPNSLAKPFQEDAKTLGQCALDRDPEMSQTDATRQGLKMMLSVLADFYLDALHKITGNQVPLINADQPKMVDRLIKTHNSQSIISAMRRLSQAEANLSRNANIELTLEAMFIQLAKATGN